MVKRLLGICFLLFSVFTVSAQKAQITGVVLDSASGKPLEGANVVIQGQNLNTITNAKGRFSLLVPSDRLLRLQASYVSKVVSRNIGPYKSGTTHELTIRISSAILGVEVEVSGTKRHQPPSVIRLESKNLFKASNPGSFENILKTLPGVSGNNELSATYNVRGGNYDENLIYVNGIEIYRPQLIRSGQQEGLSFIQPNLVDNIEFSAGGFQAQYGDKLSSVLDVQYRDPDSFAVRANLSMLGAEVSVEGAPNTRLSYMVGARYRSNAYLFGTLDVQGDYKPVFADVQALIRYHINSKWTLNALSAFAHNRFQFVPQSQTTSFGTVTEALQLSVFFNGGELMRYNTWTNGLTFDYHPNEFFQMKFIGSAIHSNEREFYTVEGAYRLDELDKNLGSATFGQAKFNRGYGYFINHARNELQVQAYTGAAKGSYYKGFWNLKFGMQYRKEIIMDDLNEWVYNDSADYSVPFNSGDSVFLFSRTRSENELNSNRISAYIQQDWTLDSASNMRLNTGIRTHYWDLNRQNVMSPRVQLSFEPNRSFNKRVGADSLKKKNITLKAAWGIYYQPPFYRELRAINGVVNRDLKAQRSMHFVLGGDMIFKIWDRPFKFFGEAYYKQLDNMVPYLFDNVRIRYLANNNASGYAAGIDTRINGEFIKGLESWFSLSVLQTKERILYENEAGQTVESDWLRRPTDQRVNFAIFFQDELPKFPKFKVNVNLVYGSGLPYFLGGEYRYNDAFRIPAYRRVDMGFSREIISPQDPAKKAFWKRFNTVWVSLDVFNILGVANTVSYIWVRDVTGDTYAVPNYLTGRRVNLNLKVIF